jgi:hypothetical protein
MHYDRHKREWVEDEVVSDDREWKNGSN